MVGHMANNGTERLKKQFGKNLTRYRIEEELTQEELAERCDVSVETISFIERGIHGPRFELLSKLAQVFRIEVRDLFDFS